MNIFNDYPLMVSIPCAFLGGFLFVSSLGALSPGPDPRVDVDHVEWDRSLWLESGTIRGRQVTGRVLFQVNDPDIMLVDGEQPADEWLYGLPGSILRRSRAIPGPESGYERSSRTLRLASRPDAGRPRCWSLYFSCRDVLVPAVP